MHNTFSSLTITPLTLTYQALESYTFPDYHGSMLRGLFGAVLTDMENNKKMKTIGKHKLSALLFDNLLSKKHPWHLANKPPAIQCPQCMQYKPLPKYTDLKDPPRGFWLTLNQNEKHVCNAGDTYVFTISLCGFYADWFELLLPVFIEMGNVGFGSEKRKFRLLSISQQHADGHNHIVWHIAKPRTIGQTFSFGYNDFSKAKFRSGEFSLYLESPTALSKSFDIYGSLAFDKLIESLARRAVLLSNLYCDSDFSWDDSFLDSTRNVRIAKCHLQWNSYRRYSLRRDEEGVIEGYTGMVHYCFSEKALKYLNRYLPLLLTGQYIHAGRNIVFGGGKYSIAHESYRLI